MPELWSMLMLGGSILTMAPMDCQKRIAQTLRDRRWTMSRYQ
jgi:predicted transposase YbfD/YdcC